jgi:uncharacterized protein YbjT (DUF2867 family)
MARVPYASVKIAAEELVRSSPVPWSIVRATGFYWLLDRLLAGMTRRRVVFLPAGVSMQPVDSDDFADYVVETATGGPRGERQDFVGPDTLTMREADRKGAVSGSSPQQWSRSRGVNPLWIDMYPVAPVK